MKKSLIVFLVLCLLVTSGVAENASGVPSKTTRDGARIISVEPEEGSSTSEEVVGAMVETDEEKIAMADSVVSEMYQFVNDPDADNQIIDYFPEEIQAAILAELPEGISAESLVVIDVLAVDLAYDAQAFVTKPVCILVAPQTPVQMEETVISVIATIGKEENSEELVVEWTVCKDTKVEAYVKDGETLYEISTLLSPEFLNTISASAEKANVIFYLRPQMDD